MGDERAPCLLLQRAEPGIVLIATARVRTHGDRVPGLEHAARRARSGHVSGPVIATLNTGMTARQRSTNVSSVGCPVAGSISLTFAGSGIETRTRPFSTRFE